MVKKTVKTSNTTEIMIMPVYGLLMDVYEQCGFVGAYIAHEGRVYTQDVVVMVFSTGEEYAESFGDLSTVLEEYLVDMYAVDDKLVALVLQIPEELQDDYWAIIESRYHELSPAYRALVSDRPEVDRKGIGKRLPLLIAERDERVMKLMLEANGGMDAGYDQVWRKFIWSDEVLTQEKINKIISEL